MIQTRHNNLNTGTINLSETKEKFLENILREISPQLTDKQYNTLRKKCNNETGLKRHNYFYKLIKTE